MRQLTHPLTRPSNRLPSGFHALIAAQFASALGDNALLIVLIARLHELGLPAWWAPLLKFGFTLSYVLLAPLVGPLADAVPKGRLMAWMNGVKVLGVVALLAGVHPMLAFAVIGFGAAAYAPAKYGLITEIVPAHALVAANGWIEVTVVGAVLLGTVLGGVLVSPMWLGTALAAQAQTELTTLTTWGGDLPSSPASTLTLSMAATLLLYATAAALNRLIPDSGARYPACSVHPVALWRDFIASNRLLWRDRDGGLSLAVTTLFWGVGATLQFAVLRWAGTVLGLPLDRAAYLQAAVAIGVVIGAGAAGRWVPLAQARRMLLAGVALGLLMPVVAHVTSLWLALPLLLGIGAVGGLMVVPLNAMLQHRGCVLLSAGRSIAVQGFNENASVLAMLAVYTGLLALDVPIVPLMSAFGLLIAAAIAALRRRDQRDQRAGTGG